MIRRLAGVRSSVCRIVDISSLTLPWTDIIRSICGKGLGLREPSSDEVPSEGKGQEICSSRRVRGRPVPYVSVRLQFRTNLAKDLPREMIRSMK